MYIVEDKGGAIALMLAALLFLGTWPAILTLLERRGRLPQHTYLDYSITNLLAAVIIALTFGQLGNPKPGMPNFFTQLSQDNFPSVLFAMAGGIVLSLGNLSTQYAWAYVGLSVTEVITSSITVVIGTTMNYFLDDRINRADILFPGVGCFLVAVCLGSAVHSSNSADNEKKLSGSSDYKEKTWAIENSGVRKDVQDKDVTKNLEEGNSHILASTPKIEKAKAGSADFLIELEKRRSIKVWGSSTFKGLCIVFFAGICFSLFSPAFNLATNDQWHTLKDEDWNGRQWAFLAGFLCGFGNGFQFMGGQAAGYAAADAVQALPLVSTFWGIYLFGEYRRSSKRTYILLVSMLFMFVVAVGVLMASSGHRKT
eukprot:TRINITY_DN108_c0_g1_i1.p1 TRINITY_DN108_c0_g1~~TRINITY_DN108_c0_g1_i1.p1  ORF type:complete len:369 (+),score=69.42 TRINITY_DN108_c0_g1_i1:461-1567(+)